MRDRVEMEMRLIGKLMSDSSQYYDLHGMLSEDIFEDKLNKKLYVSISNILNKGGKLDIIGVTKGEKNNKLDLRLMECIGTDHYAYIGKNIVLFLSQEDKKFRLKKLAESTIKKLDNGDDLFDVIEHVDENMREISEVKSSEMPDIKKQLKILHEDIDRRIQKGEEKIIRLGLSKEY